MRKHLLCACSRQHRSLGFPSTNITHFFLFCLVMLLFSSVHRPLGKMPDVVSPLSLNKREIGSLLLLFWQLVKNNLKTESKILNIHYCCIHFIVSGGAMKIMIENWAANTERLRNADVSFIFFESYIRVNWNRKTKWRSS